MCRGLKLYLRFWVCKVVAPHDFRFFPSRFVGRRCGPWCRAHHWLDWSQVSWLDSWSATMKPQCLNSSPGNKITYGGWMGGLCKISCTFTFISGTKQYHLLILVNVTFHHLCIEILAKCNEVLGNIQAFLMSHNDSALPQVLYSPSIYLCSYHFLLIA